MSYKKSKYLNWIIWFNLFIGLYNLYLYTISGWWFSFFIGSLNIGGCNESHEILYPETATCDTKILEEKFDEYIKSPTKVIKDVQYAWEKLNETYSFKTVRKQLEDLYE